MSEQLFGGFSRQELRSATAAVGRAPHSPSIVNAVIDLFDAMEKAETALELASYERSSANEAADILLRALGWNAGGLAAMAIEVTTRLATAEAERDAAFKMSKCECGPEECCQNLVAAWTRTKKAEARVKELENENNTLRGLLGNSAKPCPYCGLAAEDQGMCSRGFPGCARADDQMLSKHFADAYALQQAEARIKELEGGK